MAGTAAGIAGCRRHARLVAQSSKMTPSLAFATVVDKFPSAPTAARFSADLICSFVSISDCSNACAVSTLHASRPPLWPGEAYASSTAFSARIAPSSG
eukprot:gnl/TRDRNA2_/TRDRNA2_124397_c1_seq1.p2 gnl/TRDRNA2_/TRDRNA2_124397_c1~~gnl/TRDRNA2_/TRDRNA2_124397_c1_seq1.p2  ORF type:complete len:114 (-),score=9.32 gnl/TRDRNA2_/TRDRNA2_124397_c1_seq1:101-394(-)